MNKQLAGVLTAVVLVGATVIGCSSNTDANDSNETTAASTHAGVSIAVVDGNEVFQKFQPAIEEDLKDEFKDQQQKLMKLQEELQKMSEQLDKDGSIMSEAEVNKLQQKFAEKQMEFQQLSVEYSEAYNERGNEEFQALVEKVQTAAKNVAVKNGYTFVIQRGAVLYADDKYDVTKELVQQLDEMK